MFVELTEEKVMSLLKDTAKKLSQNKCYPSTLYAEFSNDTFQTYSEEIMKTLLSDLNVICDSLQKSQSSAEKFYADFYSKIVENAQNYFKEFTLKAATLFSTKLATSLLQSIKYSQGSDQRKT